MLTPSDDAGRRIVQEWRRLLNDEAYGYRISFRRWVFVFLGLGMLFFAGLAVSFAAYGPFMDVVRPVLGGAVVAAGMVVIFWMVQTQFAAAKQYGFTTRQSWKLDITSTPDRFKASLANLREKQGLTNQQSELTHGPAHPQDLPGTLRERVRSEWATRLGPAGMADFRASSIWIAIGAFFTPTILYPVILLPAQLVPNEFVPYEFIAIAAGITVIWIVVAIRATALRRQARTKAGAQHGLTAEQSEHLSLRSHTRFDESLAALTGPTT